MIKVKNPVLKGFNPDPSICYANGKFYIAASTFEYFPGLSIHESSDLTNFKLVSRPLDTKKFLDMEGNKMSSGVWAPCLSFDNGLFYIVYSNMKSWAAQPFKDSQNFIITSPSITGPWSDPVYINSSGFDASLFHDSDGKKYFVNMEWDHRKGGGDESFSGILVQEIDSKTFELIGEAKKIFGGTKRGLVEGPHIYKKDGYYYLLCAEGGTSYQHAESVCRSKNVDGPYEVHPNELLITSLDTDAYLQKAGHASMAKDNEGNWYLAHLCGRPLKDYRCPLGRETSIQNIIWENGWPYLANKTTTPDTYYTVSSEEDYVVEDKLQNIIYDVNSKEFWLDFQSVRVPIKDELVFIKDNGLEFIGSQSLYSTSKQATLIRRAQAFNFEFSCTLDFNPTSFQHLAGLIYRYNEDNQFYLHVTYCENKQSKVLSIMSFDNVNPSYLGESLEVAFSGEVELILKVTQDRGQFYYKLVDGVTTAIGNDFDITILSDEYANPMGFTGSFVGMSVLDLKDYKQKAFFKNIKYKEMN